MTLFRLSFTVVLLFTSLGVRAHDFWLEPTAYHAQSPFSFSLQFKVGHREDKAHWNLAWNKIVALRTYSSDGVKDMAASVVPRTALLPGMAKTPPLESGTHVIGFESYHATSVLDADKFNQYAKDEGLTEILSYREANGKQNVAGEELYSRKAKAIVQVGNTLTDNATSPIGHTLEIVPQNHPYDLTNKTLTIQVLFKGKPLANARVEASSLTNYTETEQVVKTDNEGKATFQLNTFGPVIINTVWGIPLANRTGADFETYFSSLTFSVNHATD